MRAVRYDVSLYLTPADTAKVPLCDVTRAVAETVLSAAPEGRWMTVASEEETSDLRPDVAAHLAGPAEDAHA